MRILILGGDGYLGWPTAMHFSAEGHQVTVADNFAKRKWELEQGIAPLLPIPPLHDRVHTWNVTNKSNMQMRIGDLKNARFTYGLLDEVKPDAIVHYGEQPSAPYSMQSRAAAVDTQVNNVVGTLNILFAMQHACPESHLVKLGTMGEYGTPNIDIEEGYLTVTHNGRTDTVLYPKKPASFYHLSKVHDSHNIAFACRTWGVRATDLNQGVVYGMNTAQTEKNDKFRTSFHYDHVFGTVINRFLVQASIGEPLTVYGRGGQTRGFLDIRDTVQCVDLAVNTPADEGEFRIFNQFTEQYSVLQLAERVRQAGKRAGLSVNISHVENPRAEAEEHYYNAKHSKLADLGLKANLLTDESIDQMLATVLKHTDSVDRRNLLPTIRWKGGGTRPRTES